MRDVTFDFLLASHMSGTMLTNARFASYHLNDTNLQGRCYHHFIYEKYAV